MEPDEGNESEFTSVIDNLVSMFGHIVTKEVIATLVESCEGDLNLSVDAIMKITSDGNVMPEEDKPSTSANTNIVAPSQQSGPLISYASHAALSTGAIPRKTQRTIKSTQAFWTDQIREIITNHNKGACIMIIMRGVPGSGKSHLAKLLVESMVGPSFTNYTNHILSTDDYFMIRGQYQFDKHKLPYAHEWNQNRVRKAIDLGFSPIIVDNTNVETWEMYPYVCDGVRRGYIIEVLEPTTPWAKKANQLWKRNSHNVPLASIKRMLENFVDGVTGENLIRSFGLSYPANMIPPVLRLVPPLSPDVTSAPKSEEIPTQNTTQHVALSLSLPEVKSSAKSEEPPTQIFTQNTTPPLSTLDTQCARSSSEASTQNTTMQPSPLPLLTPKVESVFNLDGHPIEITTPHNSPPISTSEVNATLNLNEPPAQSTTQDVSNNDNFSIPTFPDNNVNETRVFSFENLIQLEDEDNLAENKHNQPESESNNSSNEEFEMLTEEENKHKLFLEAQKKVEEFEKFEEEWENGEEWDDNDKNAVAASFIHPNNSITTNSVTSSNAVSNDNTAASSETVTSPLINNTVKAKRVRKDRKEVSGMDYESTDGLMESVNNCQDWRDISLFMPPWNNPNEEQAITSTQEIPIKTTTSSTCVEIGDTDLSGKYKIITAGSRDINEFYIPPEREKIPQKRMLDKSTMTNEGIVMTFQCPQKERHFIAFRKLFSHIERDSLRYIFDSCHGDANWAVENILGGGFKYQLKKTEEGQESDSEEDNIIDSELPCTCLAAYELVPNVMKAELPEPETSPDVPGDSVIQPERKKRELTISGESMELKKQIEKNFVISDNHYSKHTLKIRNYRHGEPNKPENVNDQPSTSGMQETASGSGNSNTTAPDQDSSDDEECSASNVSESDRIVNVNVGRSFIRDLDNMFGRKDMEYPEDIKYNISIPTSLLNEINALWMESMMYQLEQFANKSAEMVKQDEIFARQIALKEQELLQEGKEPDVPDFKEIMDLELALSLHMKNVSEWRNNIPTDLAAKMTHEKLFNLFPEIKQDVLLEMLMAHNNNFEHTVEVVLMSMGRQDVLEAKNGVKKFVMAKELKRQEKVLEQQRKEMSDTEWPLLQKGEKVDMSTVQNFRDEAEKHLNVRAMNLKKAEDFIRRGITTIANYYTDIATLHKTKYDYANSMAVAALMQYHANNNPGGETVDLHYLRVKEAKENMDIFIDTHIRRLRDTNKRNVVLFFITGRGLHSPGRPKVKPACIKRLQERGLHHTECNPGLIRARVSCDDKLTYQIP